MLQKLQEYTDHMHLNLITVWVQSGVYSSVFSFGLFRFGCNWAEILLGWFGLDLGLEWVGLVQSGVLLVALSCVRARCRRKEKSCVRKGYSYHIILPLPDLGF